MRDIWCYFILICVQLMQHVVQSKNDFELTILHTNDVHSHVEQFNKYGGSCTVESECFGGVARRHTVIERIRKTSNNVLLIDGGDQFSGTFWFSFYEGIAAATFMNYSKYDAMVSYLNCGILIEFFSFT